MKPRKCPSCHAQSIRPTWPPARRAWHEPERLFCPGCGARCFGDTRAEWLCLLGVCFNLAAGVSLLGWGFFKPLAIAGIVFIGAAFLFYRRVLLEPEQAGT